jgi:hypothetical protein
MEAKTVPAVLPAQDYTAEFGITVGQVRRGQMFQSVV